MYKIKSGYSLLSRMGILTWIILFVLWNIGATFYTKDFFPSPLETIAGGKEILLDGTLFSFILISLRRVFAGWSLGILIAIPIGLLIGRSKGAREIVEPLIDFLRFVPAIAFLTLFIMWFGVGEESKIILIMYATIFPVLINTVSGVLSIDSNKIQAARSLGASEIQIVFFVIIPSAVPYIFTGIRLGMGGAFSSIVAAEMLAAKEGIGYMIFTARMYFRTDWIFVGLISLGLMGYTADKLLRIFGTMALKKYGVKMNGEFGSNK